MTIRKKNIDPKTLLGGPERRDLVDVGELHYKLCKVADEYEGDMIPVDVAFDLIATAPVVDAAPVVHGKWIDDYDTFVQDNGTKSEPVHTGFVCSVCGRHSFAIEPYCHCGAKMKGGDYEIRQGPSY